MVLGTIISTKEGRGTSVFGDGVFKILEIFGDSNVEISRYVIVEKEVKYVAC